MSNSPANTRRSPVSAWERWYPAAIFVIALSLRLIYFGDAQKSPFFEHPRLDGLFHDRWAQSIASGNLLGDEVYFRAPLYPYLLGGVYATFGHSLLIPRILQHVLGALGVVLVFLLARRYFNFPSAVIASLLAAAYAVTIYFEGELLFESLLAFLCVLWFAVLPRPEEQRKWRWLLAGFVFGIICITRPTFLVVGAILLVIVAAHFVQSRGWRHSLRVALLLAAGCAIPILPVTVRNYVVGHEFVLIASQGGINFYIGNNPKADGFSSAIPDALGKSWENRDIEFQVEKVLGRKPTASDVSGYWYARALGFIGDSPAHFVSLLVKKLYLFWNHYEIPNNQSFYTSYSWSPLMRILPVGFWIVGPLAIVGFVRAWQIHTTRTMILFVAAYAGVTVLFFVCDRFRAPILPLMCIFSGYAVSHFITSVRKREYRTALVSVCVFLPALGLVNSDLYDLGRTAPAREELRLGLVAMERSDFTNAQTHFARAATMDPSLPNVQLSWGVAHWLSGNTQDAITRFHAELNTVGICYAAFANLSRVYLSERQPDSAVFYGRQAIPVKPYLPAAYVSTAQAYLLMNAPVTAESLLHAGLRSCGDDFLYGEYVLAGFEAEHRNVDGAEARYRSILRRLEHEKQPRYEPEFQFSHEARMGEDRTTLKAKVRYGLGHIAVAQGDIKTAVLHFRSAVEALPTFADAWADLGTGLLRTRQFELAGEAFTRALSLDSTNHVFWFNYAVLLETTNALPEARVALERCLRLRPDFKPATENLRRFSAGSKLP